MIEYFIGCQLQKQERYPVHVRGLNGATVQGYYDAHGGPTAYIGTAVPDIPNFYLIAGEFRVEHVVINCSLR